MSATRQALGTGTGPRGGTCIGGSCSCETNLNDNQKTIWLTSKRGTGNEEERERENQSRNPSSKPEPNNNEQATNLSWTPTRTHGTWTQDQEQGPWTVDCGHLFAFEKSWVPRQDHQLFDLKANCSHAAGAPAKTRKPLIRHRILKA